MRTRRLRAALVLAAVLLLLQACGDGAEEPSEPAAQDAQADDGQAASDDESAPQDDDATGDDAGSDGDASQGEADDQADASDAGDAAPIEVDASALPTTLTGFDTLAADLCSLYSVEELDAFFGGAGDLAVSEPLAGGCRWAVDGLPRSHYVDIEVTDEGAVFGIMEGDRVDVAGAEVHLQRGPGDAWATVPTPDGRFLAILVHGDFDVEQRPLDGGLDPAALALAQNVLSRF